MKSLVKKYALYLIRWQLSTPLLALCVVAFAAWGTTWSTVLANLIGGLIFFWIDRWIFNRTNILQGEVWEVYKKHIICPDCGHVSNKGFRLVKRTKYDKFTDPKPEFRCKACSATKYQRDWGQQ